MQTRPRKPSALDLQIAAGLGEVEAVRRILADSGPLLKQSDLSRAATAAELYGHPRVERQILARMDPKVEEGRARMFSELFSSAEDPKMRASAVRAVLPVTIGGKYALDEWIGSGGFADVFSSGPNLAAKIVLKSRLDPAELAAYERLLPGCGAHFVCTYRSFEFSFGGERWTAIVQERMTGDLDSLSSEDASALGYLWIDLLLALDCVHSQGLAHMDVKAQNVYWKRAEDRVHFKLADPGAACARQPMGKLRSCTLFGSYFPPEIRHASDYRLDRPIAFELAEKIDVWCAAFLLYSQMAAAGYADPSIAEVLLEASAWDEPRKGFSKAMIPRSVPFSAKARRGQFGPVSGRALVRTLDKVLNAQTEEIPSARELFESLAADSHWTAERRAELSRGLPCPVR